MLSMAAAAQDTWRARAIRVIIGFPPGTAPELNALIASDDARWGRLIKTQGIRPE